MSDAALLLTFARRGEEEPIRRAMALLRPAGAQAGLVALGTSVSAPVLRGLGVPEVLVLGEDGSARAVVAKLRQRRPRTAAIVYCGPRFGGHLKLEALALLSGARQVVRVLPEGEARLGRFRLALSVAAKSTQAACCLAAGGAVVTVAWAWLQMAQGRKGGRRASRA
jgi:hypothetical protein